MRRVHGGFVAASRGRRDPSWSGLAVRLFRKFATCEITIRLTMAVASRRCGEALVYGEKTENLSDFAGLFRSGNCRAVDESGSASVGRRQQSLRPGRGEGN